MMRVHMKAAAIGLALSLAALGGASTSSGAKPISKASTKASTKDGKMIIRKVPG